MAVAVTFDAMTTERPYRKAMSTQSALDVLRENEGKQLDGDIVENFIHYCAMGRESLGSGPSV
jgi:HD-GYP domain-containing protein (c-di-GMP phosphodiesterase class II)